MELRIKKQYWRHKNGGVGSEYTVQEKRRAFFHTYWVTIRTSDGMVCFDLTFKTLKEAKEYMKRRSNEIPESEIVDL